MEELDLKELIEIFWSQKIPIILIIAIFMVLGFIYTIEFVIPEYQASTTLVLAKSDNAEEQIQESNTITTTEITLNSKLVSTYSELVKSKNVIREVIANLGLDEEEESIRKGITVKSVKDTELIEIIVTDLNATDAAKIANEIAKVFTQKVMEIYNINNVYVVDEAEVSDRPSNVNLVKDIIIFAFIGIAVAIVYVLVMNMLDTTIKSQEEIEKLFKVPVLASIPLNQIEKGGKK